MPSPADQQKSTEGSQAGRKPGARRRGRKSLMQQMSDGDQGSQLPSTEPPAVSPAGPDKKRKKITLMESLILYGEPTAHVCGRPRKSNASGTVMGMCCFNLHIFNSTDNHE